MLSVRSRFLPDNIVNMFTKRAVFLLHTLVDGLNKFFNRLSSIFSSSDSCKMLDGLYLFDIERNQLEDSVI